MKILVLLLLFITEAYALHFSKKEFCATQADADVILGKKRFTVEGNKPNPILLATVARLMDEFHIPGPLIFHFTDTQGPRKVWSLDLSSGKHIYFAKNAVDLLLGIELKKIADEVCRPGFAGTKSFTIAYTNTVLEQFLRHAASHESLKSTLRKKTGWKFRSESTDKYYDNEQEFRTEELVSLVKQLMDVPAEVFQKMKLKSLVRWRYGATLPIAGASAMYVVDEQKIMFSDGAFIDTTEIYGEGTILHEMGHAYWYGIPIEVRDRYSMISWKKHGDQWEKKDQSSEGFITAYSMQSPEEDFAEHFSAFLNNPEFLKRRAMAKNNYLEDHVFKDVTYFTTVAENAKIKITSPNPDTKDPWLENSIDFRSKVVAVPRNDGSKITDVTMVVDKAYDDISGVADTLQSFTHKDNSEYYVLIDLKSEKQKDGSWTLRGEIATNPDKLAPGTYVATSFSLRDQAGNRTYYTPTVPHEIHLDGNLSGSGTPQVDFDVTKISLEKAETIEGYPGIITTLPINMTENMDSIHLTWELENLQEKTVHVCSVKPLQNCMVTEKFGDQLKLKSYFFKEYPDSRIKLANITITFKGSSEKSKGTQRVVVPASLPNASTYIVTGHKDMLVHDLDVNAMKLRAITKPNKEGGDQNIEVSIPLLNREAGLFYVRSYVRSPTGKSIYGSAYESEYKKAFPEYEISKANGQYLLKYMIPLKKNPEDGVYIIESFSTETKFPQPRHLRLPLDLGDATEKRIKLIERGIRRTFTIGDDKVIELH